jgi:hypothetical protein
LENIKTKSSRISIFQVFDSGRKGKFNNEHDNSNGAKDYENISKTEKGFYCEVGFHETILVQVFQLTGLKARISLGHGTPCPYIQIWWTVPTLHLKARAGRRYRHFSHFDWGGGEGKGLRP